MKVLTDRQTKILYFISKTKDYVKSEIIANELSVSEKTIQREVKVINDILKKYDCAIKTSKGRGYCYPIESKKSLEVFLDLQKSESQLVPTLQCNRVDWLIRKFVILSLQDKECTLEELCAELFVSLSTIKKDIKETKSILKKYNVNLLKKSNKGLIISGKEVDIRKVIGDYLINNKKQMNLEKILSVSSTQREKIEAGVLQSIQNNKIHITDIGFTNLILHIEIAISRLKLKKAISNDNVEITDLTSKEYLCVKEITNYLEDNIFKPIPSVEIVNIYQHLIAQKKLLDKDDEIVIDEEINEVINRTLNEIYTIYHINLFGDKFLLYGLSAHLESALNRIRMNMPIYNELLEEIRENYIFQMELAKILARRLEEKLQIEIDQNEVGFLALHFGGALERANSKKKGTPIKCILVCASGIGTSVLLKTKIKTKFQNCIEVKGVYAAYQLNDFDFSNIDLIISTIPLKEKFKVPCVYVTPIVTDNDINTIEKYVKYGENCNEIDISKLFSKQIFFKDLDCTNREECLEVMTNKLYDLGYIDDECRKSYFEREKMATTEIGNKVCVPHSIEGKIYKMGVCIGILKNPITWEYGKVQLIVMLVVNKDLLKKQEEFFTRIYKQIDCSYKVEEIIKQKNIKYIKSLFEED